MSATLSKSYGLAEAEDLLGTKQGIVSILGSDTDRPSSKPAASLRRTLSADMSSKKWLSRNGPFPMKKIASSEEFPAEIIDSSSSEEEDEEFRFKNEYKRDESNPGQCDIWNLIITQKSKEGNSESLPPPYIHPLVKRSTSSLSEKSLEICTESLGSETGSDGFSSYPPSENGDADDDRDYSKQGQSLSFDEEDTRFVKTNYVNGGRRTGQPRSFPPPIPSLALNDGASVRMKTHRDNGRLVMEAVSVPSQNNFRAERHNGRLVLTFANSPALDEPDEKNEETEDEDEKASMEEMDFEFDSFENDEDGEEEEEETESEDDFEIDNLEEEEEEESEKAKDSNFANKLPALFNYKPSTVTFTNRSPRWPNRLNKIVNLGDKLADEKPAEPMIRPLAQSLPPRPKPARMIPAPPSTAVAAAAAGSCNAYEYYWRPKPMEMSSGLNFDEQHSQSLKSSHNNLALSKYQVANLRGQKGDHLVPLLNGCKEPRRSLLFWEPHCIATS